jgi:hypothetical protein
MTTRVYTNYGCLKYVCISILKSEGFCFLHKIRRKKNLLIEEKILQEALIDYFLCFLVVLLETNMIPL